MFNIAGRADLDVRLKVNGPFDRVLSIHETDSQAFIDVRDDGCAGASYEYSYSVRLSNLIEDDYNTYTGRLTVGKSHRQCRIDISPYSGSASVNCYE